MVLAFSKKPCPDLKNKLLLGSANLTACFFGSIMKKEVAVVNNKSGLNIFYIMAAAA